MRKTSIPKRVLALLLSAAIFASIGVATIVDAAAKAANTVDLTVGTVEGTKGQEVQIPVTMNAKDNEVGSFDATINYDPEQLELVHNDRGEPKVIFGSTVNANAISNSPSPGILMLSGGSLYGITDETIFTVSFVVKEGASGNCPISLSDVFVSDNTQQANELETKLISGGVNVSVPLNSISLSQTSLDLAKGESSKLDVIYNPDNTTDDKTVEWSTGDDTVATVSKNGTVQAVGKGTTTITAKVGEKTATCNVTVSVPLQSIFLNQDKLTLDKGENSQLTVSALPEDTTDTNPYNWTSDNQSVATVNQNGLVTAVGQGTATITVSRGDKTASCEVVVSAPLESISIQPTLELLKKQTAALTITYNPENTTDDKTAVWSSSDDKIATVDQNGVVTAVAPGKATIIAKVGKHEAACTVTVKEQPLNSIALNKQEMTLDKGKTESLTVTYNPEDTTDDKTVVWSTSDSNVATVKNGVVTAVGVGKATITATVGEKQAKCEVTVTSPLDHITIPSTAKVNKGETTSLSVSYFPEDTTDSKDVVWTSSNSAVASVKDGVVTGHMAGTAVITANVGGKQASCTVTVEVPLQYVSIAGIEEYTTMSRGESLQLGVNYYPQDTTANKAVRWTSSDESVVKIDENGKMTAVGGGEAVVNVVSDYAVGKNPTVKEYRVKVIVPLESISLMPAELTLEVGDTSTTELNYFPVDFTVSDTMKYSIDIEDPNVVSVARDGDKFTVKALSQGSTSFTVTVDEKYQATCTVQVLQPIQSISLNKTELSLLKGGSETLTVNIDPPNADGDKSVVWSSSDETIATVNNGVVTGLKAGTAKITAAVGKHTATCTVTVQEIKIESVTLDKTELSLDKGDTAELTATVNPENTTDDKTVLWSTSDPNVALVNSNGVVTAVGGGTAKITAKAGDKSAECTVTVEIPLGSIALSQTTASLISGRDTTLVVRFNPEDTTADKTVLWSTSDPSVVTVSNGVVTAVGKGKATVTARVGSLSATCEFTVIEASDKIPAQTVIDQLKDESVDEVVVNLTQPDVVTKEIFEAAKGIDKNITFNIVDESGSILYSWSFNGKDVKDVSKDVDLAIEVGAENDAITSLVGDERALILSFAHKGELPVNMSVRVFVGDHFADGQPLWYYTYNPETSSLELVSSELTVEDHFIELSLTSCSDLVFSAKEVKDPEPGESSTPSNSGSSSQGSGSHGDTPKTGEVTTVALMAAAMACALGAAFVMYTRKKHED